MTKIEALDGKPYAGNPHARFDENECALMVAQWCKSRLFRAVLFLLVTVSAMTSCWAVPVLYVKPGGMGAGSSWSDAADLEAAVAAAKAAGGEHHLYLAKGIYYPSATVKLSNGISLYGSFPGLADDETLESRSVKYTPSIISGDVGKNDYWETYDANEGKVTPQSSWPVIADGAINIPSDLDDYVTVVPASASVQDNLIRLLTVLPGSACTLDGIVLQGGGIGETKDKDAIVEDGLLRNYGGSLFVGAGATVTIRGCRVAGACARETVVHFDGTEAQPTTCHAENLCVEYCRGTRTAAMGMTSYASVTLSNCTFLGNARYHKYQFAETESAAALKVGNLIQMGDCHFERNIVLRNRGEWQNASTVMSVPYCTGLQAKADALRGLKFVANACWAGGSNIGHAFPLVGIGVGNCRFDGWTVARNMIKSSSPNPLRCSLIGGATDYRFTLENSTVFSNRLEVVADETSEEVFVAPVVGRNLTQFVNCTFFDNEVSVTAPDTCAVYASRAVISVKQAGDDMGKRRCVSCFNCTFSGSTPLPDVVDGGVDYTNVCSFVANSILWATGAAANTPRVMAYGNKESNTVELANCIVRSPKLLPERVLESGAVTGEDPLLEPLRYLSENDSVPVMRCGALTPMIRRSFDIKQKTSRYNLHILAYFPGGSMSGGKTRDGNDSGNTSCITDALGNVRPVGAFTLGAVQPVAPKAETGITVVFRARPEKAGTVDGANAMKTEVFSVGETAGAITATAADGYGFNSWRDEDGEVLGANAAYTPSTLAAASFYADAWFASESDSITVTPADNLQDALDSLALRGGMTTLNLSAGTYFVAKTLKSKSGKLTVSGGGKAILTGDRNEQMYWQKADGTVVTDSGGNVVRVFENGVFNEPEPTKEDFYWRAMPDGTAPTRTLFDVRTTRDDEGAGMQVVFDGVTFAAGAVDVGRAESTFRDCRFLACQNGEGEAVLNSWTNLVLSGTSFVGNFGLPVADNAGQIVKSTCRWFVTNCVFKANAGGGESRGPGLSPRNADIDIFDTEFRKNASYKCRAYYGSLVSPADYSKVRLVGCVFAENAFSNTPAIVTFPYAARGIVSNCLFSANRVFGDVDDMSHTYGAVVFSSDGGAALYNTTFLSNEVDFARSKIKDGTTNGIACVVYGKASVGFVNCHLEGNRTRYTGPDGQVDFSAYSCTVYAGGRKRYPFVGTSFYENDFLNGELLVNRYSTSYGLYFVNSIFWGNSDGYAPLAWINTTQNYLDFYNCIVKNAPAAGGTGTIGVVHEYVSCYDENPQFGELKERDRRFYRPIGRLGKARSAGVPVGLGADGALVFKKPNGKWYSCTEPWEESTFAQRYAVDMFGELPRYEDRPDLGPVQNTVPRVSTRIVIR